MIRLLTMATVVWSTFFATYIGLAHEAPKPQPNTIAPVMGGQAIGECPASNPNVRLMFDYTVPVACTGQNTACPGRLVCFKDGNKTCSFVPGECNTCVVPQRRYVCLTDDQLKEAER